MKFFVCILAIIMFVAGCVNIFKPGTGGDLNGAAAVVIGVENGYAGKCDGTLKDADDMV